jgi:hypothetical protein
LIRVVATTAVALAVLGCTTSAQPPAPGAAGGREAKGATATLPSELQAKVDHLRAEARQTPTDNENVYARADVVWQWANSLALSGLAIPPDLPLTVTLIRWAKSDGGEIEKMPGIAMPLAMHIRRLDRYVKELALIQEGGKLGELRFAASDPLESRAWTTIEETYTVGDLPIAPGGGFMLGVAGTGQEGRAQHEDPKAPAYVTARASRAGVTFERAIEKWNGVHGSVPDTAPLPVFRVAGATLEPGDTVTFTYGDRSQGSKGLQVPTFSNDVWLLPIYVDPDGSGDFFGLRWPTIAIVGKPEIVAVRLLGPSVVKRGEPFSVTVRSEDDAMNRAGGPTPAYEILLDGTVVGRIVAGRTPLARVDGIRIDRVGVHRLEVRGADSRLIARGNPVRVEEAPERLVLWGETHGHTAFAEGQGSPEAFFTYATDDARLDFATLSEHDIWLDDAEWRELQRLTRQSSVAGKFVGILGYEWTAFPNRGGHHNVFFRDPDSERVGVHVAYRLPDLYRGLHQRYQPEQVLVIPHAHMAGDWNQSDAELERLVELYSVHGSFEWFANKYLQNGFQVGFVAAADDHLAKPGLAPPPLSSVSQPGGLAAIFAPEATGDAVFDALRNLRSYATSGQRILLGAKLNGHDMGTRQGASDRREIEAEVAGTAPIDRIDIVRNGAVVHSRSYLAAELASSSSLQVAFESSSEVFGAVDNPRGYRVWRGTLEVEGARITGVRRTGLDNPLRDRLEWDPATPQSVRFSILTRGRADSILLDLDGAGAQTRLHFLLEATKEMGAASTRRPLHDVPAADFTLALDALEKGRLEHEMAPVGEHVDRVSLQVVNPDAPLDQKLEYTDLDAKGDGDYYYVRVTQLDGGRAWSSPFWVGPRSPGGSGRGRRSRAAGGKTGRASN